MNNTLYIFITLLLFALIVSPLCGARAAPGLQDLHPVSISECERAADFDPAGADEAAEISNLSTTAGARIKGHSIRWRIESPPVSTAAVKTDWSPEGKPAAVGVWLKNPRGHDLSIALEALTSEGSGKLGSQKLGKERNWHQLSFTDTQSVKWRSVTGLRLRVDGLKQETDYSLYIDRIEAYYPPPLSAKATIDDLPQEARAGETVEIQTTLTPASDAPDWPEISAVLVQGDFRLSACPVSFPESPSAGKTQSVKSVTLRLPQFLSEGTYMVKLAGPNVKISETDWPTISVTNKAPRPTASVDGGDRAARISFDDGPISPVLVRCDKPGNVQNAPSGTTIVANVTASYDLYGRAAEVWRGPEE